MKTTQSFIANGRTLGDVSGKFTCHEYNRSSTVDYAVIKECMAEFVQSFHVLDPNIGSDHCPIKLRIKIPQKIQSKRDNLMGIHRIRWDEKTKLSFSIKMKSPATLKKIESTNEMLLNPDVDIKQVLKEFSEIIMPKKINPKKKKSIRKHKPKKWYDYSCHEMSLRLKNVVKLLADSPTNPDIRGSFCKTRKEYKKLLKLKKREWTQSMISKLEAAEAKDPKEYWKMVNELRDKKSSENSFNTTTFVDFFKNLFSPSEPNLEVEKYVLDSLNDVRS